MSAKANGARNEQRLAQGFPIDSAVRLICASEYRGVVIGHDRDAVRVTFRIGDMLATGTHSPEAIEHISPNLTGRRETP